MEGGAAPPAFQESERKRIEAERKKEEEGEEEEELLITWVNARKKKWKGNAKGKAGNQDGRTTLAKGHLAKGDGKGTFQKDRGVSKDFPASPVASYEGDKRTDDPSKPEAQDHSKMESMNMASSRRDPDKDLERLSLCHEGSEMDSSDTHLRADNVEKSQNNSDDAKPVDILNEVDEQEDTLSDIDDDEVDGYLHNQEEVRLKTMIWTEMNKEYLEAQQAKQEALAAAQAAQEAVLQAAGSDSAELLAATAAAIAEKKKDRKRRREEAKSKGPAESATEAARQMLQSKRLSSKVNYSALEKLFDGEVTTEAKKNIDSNENGMGKDDTKDKHVKWADSVASKEHLEGGKNDDKISTDVQAEKGLGSQVEEEEEEEEEEQDLEDYGANMEEQQSHYGEDYGGDFGDDGYDEY